MDKNYTKNTATSRSKKNSRSSYGRSKKEENSQGSFQREKTQGSPRRSFSQNSFNSKGGAEKKSFYAPRGRSQSSRRGKSDMIHFSRFISSAEVQTKENTFIPKNSFESLPLHKNLKKIILERGYKTPTPIQDATMLPLIEGKDVVGIANTGTGKTGAFLIPLIHKVLENNKEQVLIITPTRELALQIHEELKSLTRGLNIFGVTCVGGMSIAPQLRALRQHNHFIIGTPGRLKDLVERKSLHLSSLRTLVLDEADRMLDMGFVLEMKYVIERMPKERHTLLFTATLSKEIAKTAEEFLHNPEHISVKTADTSKNIEQDVIHIGREENKIDILHKLLEDASFEKVLVFGRTKHGVEQLSQMLHKRGVHSASIHGNKSHSQRVRALDDFKKNRARVLVATDVAARGLDIPLVSHVINYDVPGTYDDYVHRIGRTGRADKTGKALTFIGSGTRSTEEKESFSSFGRGFQNTGRGRSGGGIKKPSEKRNSSFRRERNTFEKKR